MQIVYTGNNIAKEIPSMDAPNVQDFWDPYHYDCYVEQFKEHCNQLRTFDVHPALAEKMQEGKIYDESFFTQTIVLTAK